MLMLSYTYSITNPAELETITFNVSDDDDLSISAPALQNATVTISYTCTVSPLPSNTIASKSGSSGIQDFMRMKFVGYLLLLVLAFVF